VYIHVPTVDAVDGANRPIYRELIRTTSTNYVLPKIIAASAFFGVASYTSSGKTSEMTVISKTEATVLQNNWLSDTTVSWGAVIDDGGKPQSNADVTESSIIRISQIPDQVYFANPAGTVVESFSTLTIVVTRGTTVITRDADVTYEINASSGISATVSNATATKGHIIPTNFIGAEGTIEYSVLVNGVRYPGRTILFTKQLQTIEQTAPLPPAGVSASTINWPNAQFSFAAFEHVKFASRTISEAQVINFTGYGSYYFSAPFDIGVFAVMEFRVGYRLFGVSEITYGPSQPDFGLGALGELLTSGTPQEPVIGYAGSPGAIAFNVATPPLAAGDYEFFVTSRMIVTTGFAVAPNVITALQMYFEGTIGIS
jgi:hypothetical protein